MSAPNGFHAGQRAVMAHAWPRPDPYRTWRRLEPRRYRCSRAHLRLGTLLSLLFLVALFCLTFGFLLGATTARSF